MCVEIAGQVANNADTDQMPYGIWSGPTLFAKACLSK